MDEGRGHEGEDLRAWESAWRREGSEAPQKILQVRGTLLYGNGVSLALGAPRERELMREACQGTDHRFQRRKNFLKVKTVHIKNALP